MLILNFRGWDDFLLILTPPKQTKLQKGQPMSTMNILLSSRTSAIPATEATLDLLIRLQAPAQPKGKAKASRPLPKRLALVVDRSGSMDGQPLHEALRCVDHIATHLGVEDQVAVVTYDDQVDLLWPLQSSRNIEPLRAHLHRVTSGGSTDLHAGWQAGARQLEAGTSDSISRVLLLSDGQANHGETDPATIAAQCAEWNSKGVSTTTVGLGRGFNEELMIAMARAGGGRQYYGQTAEDLHDSFDEELALLQATCLRDIALKLVAAPGVIIEPLGNLPINADGTWRLSDLAWDAETWMAVRLHVSASTAATTRDLVSASFTARNAEGGEEHIGPKLLSLPVVSAKEFQALVQDDAVAKRLDEVEFAQSSLQLRDLARQGDRAGMRRLLDRLEKRFGHHPWLADKLVNLRDLAERDAEMMAKEVHFSSVKLSQRLVAHMDLDYSQDETNAEIPAFLRKKASEGRGRRK